MNTNKNRMNGMGTKASPQPARPDGDHLENGNRPVGAPPPAGDPVPGPNRPVVVPDPEVVAKGTRRFYTAEFKLRVLREADTCSLPGEIGALLRREGLYSSHLTLWRRERKGGELEGLTPKKRGAKPTRDPKDTEIERLRRENAKLEERLRIAELICAAQKKVGQILGITLARPQDDGKPS